MAATILVTGGTGYIGSHTAVELVEAGYNVHLLDNLENSFPEVVDGIEAITGQRLPLHQIDLRHRHEVQELFRRQHFDAVVHFAAYKAVGESMEEPLKYYSNNFIGLLHLLEVMEEHKMRWLVFSSSCSVYGNPGQLPVTERSPLKRTLSPYGNTKQVSEEIIREVTDTTALQSISLRYFNPVGAHPSGKIGEWPQRPNNLFPLITEALSGNRDGITIFGSDYGTPDGTCLRDYIHVVDLAKAHVLAVERLMQAENEERYEAFNLGTGRGYSVKEIIETFNEVTGQEVPHTYGERRKGDVPAVYGDASLANEKLHWKADRDLEDMVRTAWKWEQERKKKTE